MAVECDVWDQCSSHVVMEELVMLAMCSIGNLPNDLCGSNPVNWPLCYFYVAVLYSNYQANLIDENGNKIDLDVH